MEEKVEEYIERLIKECVSSPKFSSLSEEEKKDAEEKIRRHFQALMFDALIDNLTDEQIRDMKDLDLKSPEASEKIAYLSASIPGFIFILDEKIKQAARQIKESGQIPD